MKGVHAAFKVSSDVVRILFGQHANGFADCDFDVAGSRDDASVLLQIEKSADVNGDDRNIELFGQQADS